MTLSPHDEDQICRALTRDVGPTIEKALDDAVHRDVTWNWDRWRTLGLWIERDLAKQILYSDEMKAAPQQERDAMWARFKAFSEARATGKLDDPVTVRLILAVLKAMKSVGDRAEGWLEVEWEEIPLEEHAAGPMEGP